jgi:uncharacterized protein (DUF2345 family)
MRRIAPLVVIAVLMGCRSNDAKPLKETSHSATANATVAPSGPKSMAKPITEAELGIPFYAGAKVLSAAGTDRAVTASLETTAPIAEVIAFYEKELGAKAAKDSGLISIDGRKGGKSYSIVMTTGAGKTSIMIMGEKK